MGRISEKDIDVEMAGLCRIVEIAYGYRYVLRVISSIT